MRTRLGLVFGLMLLATMPLKGQTIAWYLTRGAELYQSGDPNKALDHYLNALKLEPENEDALLGTGMCYTYIRTYSKALKYFRKGKKLFPLNPNFIFHSGLVKQEQGRLRAAEKAWLLTIKTDSSFADAYFNLGTLYFIREKLPQALQRFGEYADLRPRDKMGWFNHGNTLAQMGDHRKAIADYDYAILIDDQDPEIYFNRASSHGYLANFREAHRDYSMTLELNPAAYDAYLNRGILNLQFKLTDEAIYDFTKIIREDSGGVRAWFNRGYTYVKLRDWEAAASDFKAVTNLDPKDAEAWYYRGRVAWKMGEVQQALGYFKQSIKLKPKDAQTYLYRGDLYFEQGDGKMACKDWKKVIRHGEGMLRDLGRSRFDMNCR